MKGTKAYCRVCTRYIGTRYGRLVQHLTNGGYYCGGSRLPAPVEQTTPDPSIGQP